VMTSTKVSAARRSRREGAGEKADSMAVEDVATVANLSADY
jgi:hypothetical protein